MSLSEVSHIELGEHQGESSHWLAKWTVGTGDPAGKNAALIKASFPRSMGSGVLLRCKIEAGCKVGDD